MSLLRRRPMNGAAPRGGQPGGAHFKPFVNPLKKASAQSHPGRRSGGDDGDSESKSALENQRAMQSGSTIAVKRLPVLSFFPMPPEERAVKLRQAFKSPCEGNRSVESERLLRVKTLGVRRRWCGGAMKPLIKHNLGPVTLEDVDDPIAELENQNPNAVAEPEPATPAPDAPPPPPPLVLWQSEEHPELQVVVPDIVGKWLRPHQREGVQFMFDCVTQVRGFDGQGCILADDMGLGKTLQSITLMYTLLETSMSLDRTPLIRRCIVVCPTSLVKNWDDEITKWLHGRVKTIALFEAKRDTVIQGIRQFVEGSKPTCSTMQAANAAKVLIISYETYRMHMQRFVDAPSSCDLLICDEAHRLKNANSQINRALSALACRKRVLLSGTPMQNDLEEFFAMVDFTNPSILGSSSEFRKKYLSPILVGREPDSTDREREIAQSCSAILCEVVNQFILRRGNILNAKHLPPKLMQVVCCPLSPLQDELYTHFLQSSAFKQMMRKQNANVLSSITALKKLCNHPLLIFDENGKSTSKLAGFDGCSQIFSAAKQIDGGGNADGSLSSGRRFGSERTCHPEWSGKMLLLDRLMQTMRKHSTDRIVIVSNYTQTLEVVSTLCRQRQLPHVRLDGTTSAKKRKNLVDTFNDPTTNSFAFLLSSKAGGCGLNLIGANRLVLFDPDWNPATDKQAAARVWREGQKKMCFVYRFLATGTLEEKIFQRQLSKEGLQNIVDDKEEVNSLSSKDLKRLFVLRKDTMSDTHDQLKCDRCQWRSTDEKAIEAMEDDASEDDDDASHKGTGFCPPKILEIDGDQETLDSPVDADNLLAKKGEHYHPQIGMPPEEDLNSWGHHRSYDSVDDEIMQLALADLRESLVSFAFSCRIDWQLLQDHHLGNEEEDTQRENERKRKRLEIIETERRRTEADAIQAKRPRSGRKNTRSKHDEEDEDIEVEFDLSDSDDFASGSGDESNEECSDDDKNIDEEDVVLNSASESESDSRVKEVPPSSVTPSSNCSRSPIQDSIPKHQSDGVVNVSKTITLPIPKGRKTVSFADSGEDDEDDAWYEKISGKSSSLSILGRPSRARSMRTSLAFTDQEWKDSEPPGEQTNESDLWSCSRCTLANPNDKDICAGCGLRFRRSRLQRPRTIDYDE